MITFQSILNKKPPFYCQSVHNKTFLRIETINQRLLAGKILTMSLAENRIFELCNGFMPIYKTMDNLVDSSLISLQILPQDYRPYDICQKFDK